MLGDDKFGIRQATATDRTYVPSNACSTGSHVHAAQGKWKVIKSSTAHHSFEANADTNEGMTGREALGDDFVAMVAATARAWSVPEVDVSHIYSAAEDKERKIDEMENGVLVPNEDEEGTVLTAAQVTVKPKIKSGRLFWR